VRRDPRDFLPLKDLALRILIALADGERHGWALLQELDEPGAARLLPGQLYRTLDRILEDGLIDERDEPSGRPAAATGKRGTTPSRYFRLTPLGRDVARAETDRLEALIARSRAGRLLRERR
jgi:DNA-binding PadR family transcriptional regulator